MVMGGHTEIFPCPFCGSRHTFAIQMDWSTRERKPYKIFCDSCCACSGPHDTMEGAIAAWNERIRRSIEPKWLYRLESISPENGLWYSDDAKFVFGIGKIEGCKTKDLPMGWDKRYHVEGKNWYSSCSRKEDLLHWYSKEDARKLLANGFVFTRYLANDYIEYENETVFRKECAARREEIDFFELFNNEER